MGNFLRRLFDEKTSANQLAVAVRPDENNVAVAEDVSIGDDAFRVYLLKLGVSWLRVILKVRDANDLHAFAKAAPVIVHAVAELRQIAESSDRPMGLGCHRHTSRTSATLLAMICSSSRD